MATKASRKRAEDKKDTSLFVPQRGRTKQEFKIIERDDLTERQKQFLELALDKGTKVIFLTGPAGTSKTYLAVMAVLKLMQNRLDDLIYIRSVVESADHTMGFLPGDADEKLSPYMAPLMDKLDELLPAGDIKALEKEGRFITKPIGFLRGLNWNVKGIVADEAQNFTMNELVTLMTRVGQFSKLFICGDSMQSDIGHKSGFDAVIKMFNTAEAQQQGIYTFEFTHDDIVRSELVKFIVKTVEENKKYLAH
jgi:phosphate starvation-inducible PhoH-like protein